MRSLAGRSDHAAKVIKSLIRSGVAWVEQGTARVDQAGATLTEVLSSIKQASDIMCEVSATSSGQAAVPHGSASGGTD